MLTNIRKMNLCSKISLILGILFFLSLIPLLIMGLYNHPVGDDFTYGMQTHLIWESTRSITSVLKTAAQTSRDFRYSYQGPFVSSFFMALQPAVISERLYALTTLIMLSSLIASTWLFLNVLFRKYFHVPASHFYIILFILLSLCIQLIPAPSEAFYWYCGSVHYIFMHACMLLLFSFMLLWLKENRSFTKKIYFLLSCLFSFMVGGANFVTGLLSLVLFLVLFAFCIYYKKKSGLWFLVPFSIYLFSFFLCITAPGNFIRKAEVGISPNPISAIYHAFQDCLHYMGEWNNVYFLLAIIFLLPFLWSAATYVNNPFPLPGIILLVSFCVLASTFAPSTYALGTTVIFERTLNIIMMSYYLLCILNLFYFIGWIQNQIKIQDKDLYQSANIFLQTLKNRFYKLFLSSVSICLVFLIFCTYHQNLASKSAVHDLAKGYAQAYHAEVLHRISLLTMQGVDEVWVPNYSVQPYLLELEDIHEDPHHWRNQATAQWYGKKLVHLSIIY